MNGSKSYLRGWMASSLAAIVIAGAPGSASAQSVTGGIRAGATATSLTNDESDGNRRLGANPGVFVDFNVNSRIAIRLEGAYAMKGVKEKGFDGKDYTVALDYIEAPILLSVRPSSRQSLVLRAGLAPARKVGAQIKGNGESLKYGDTVHTFDLGLVVGVGIGPVDVRYTRGLKPVFNFNDPDDTDSDDKNQSISVGVSFALFGKRRPSNQ
jgi:hypothetical protein